MMDDKTQEPKPSWRHHYVPQFYLRRWRNPEGRIWTYERQYGGKLTTDQKYPVETGFAKNLYSFKPELKGQTVANPDILERSLFQRIDHEAAGVLKYLIDNFGKKLGEAQRASWTLYLNSLTERNVERLERLEKALLEAANATVAQAKGIHPDVLAIIKPEGVARKVLLHKMKEEIEDPEVLAYISGMSWNLIRVNASTPLMTSDQPLVINMGMSERPIQELSMALTPTILFRALPDGYVEREIRELVVAHIQALLRSKARYLYTHDPESLLPEFRESIAELFGKGGPEMMEDAGG